MMKRQFLFYALTAGTLMFSACSKDDIAPSAPGNGDEKGVQTLLLSLNNGEMTMGNGRSRAESTTPGDGGAINKFGRPLFSSQADQAVDNVLIYFVYQSDSENGTTNKDKIVLLKHIDTNTWNNSVTEYKDGKSILLSLRKSENEKLPDGKYKVYAVAYSDDAGFQTFTPKKETDKINNIDSESGELKAAISDSFDADNFYVSTTDNSVSEIFAGQLDITVETTGDESKITTTSTSNQTAPGETATLTLYRQVAGITGYFTNIPVKVDNTVPATIRLVARSENKQIEFKDLGTNVSSMTGSTPNYCVNGSQKATGNANFQDETANSAYTVYEIDLDKWFVYKGEDPAADFSKCDLNNDGYVGYADVTKYLEDIKSIENTATATADDYKDFWVNPNNGNNAYKRHQGLVRGSVWAGKFVAPFKAEEGKKTLELQLLDADGQILKSWAVNLPESDLHKQGEDDEVSTGTIVTEAFDFSKSSYCIYRNHIYSLGMKKWNNGDDGEGGGDDDDDKEDDPTIPTNPEEPDEDGDNPQDLSKGQILILRVNDKWEADHGMQID